MAEMKAWWILVLVGALAAVLLEANGEHESRPPRPAHEIVVGASARTTAAPPSRVAILIGGGTVEYELRGRLDLRRGYRLCGRAAIVSEGFVPRDTALWIAGNRGSLAGVSHTYDHVARFSNVTRTPRLTWTRALRCKRSRWLDDHPPTLPLTGKNTSAASYIGAESYAHLALLALSRTVQGAASATRLADHGTYRIVFDYRRFDRRPPVRDENAWELRPLLRSAGELPIDMSIDSAGFLRRLRFAAPRPIRPDSVAKAPVTVDLKLSAIGDERPVPRATVTAIE
jgi:hypothetical protein